MLAARCAGSQLARITAAASSATTPANVHGSDGATSYSSDRSTFVATSAPAIPRTAPAAAIATPMPISRVRWATTYEITPYTPIVASASATAAKSASSAVLKRVYAVASATRDSMVATSYTGSSGASSCSARRTAPASATGLPEVRTKSIIRPAGDWAYGRYTSGLGSESSVKKRTSPTTPTTYAVSSQKPPCPTLTGRPMGSSPGQMVRAAVSLTS